VLLGPTKEKQIAFLTARVHWSYFFFEATNLQKRSLIGINPFCCLFFQFLSFFVSLTLVLCTFGLVKPNGVELNPKLAHSPGVNHVILQAKQTL